MTTTKPSKKTLDSLLHEISESTFQVLDNLHHRAGGGLSPEERKALELDYVKLSNRLQACSNTVMQVLYNFRTLKTTNLEVLEATPGEEWITLTERVSFFKEYWGLTPEDIFSGNCKPKGINDDKS
jgi:hypothetical protein